MRVNLLQTLFSGASLWRWNDKLRPVQMSEIEKQGHKMLIACVLHYLNTRDFSSEDAESTETEIIMGALADYFYRLVITDIKPPVFYKIRQNGIHYEQLTSYVLTRLAPVLSSLEGFWDFAKRWYASTEKSLARNILDASHLYASRWEFQLIRPLNSFDDEMETIAESFSEGLASHTYLKGMRELLDRDHPLGKFANLCGQLRFQIRWTQTSRSPATTVLGHMFIVAAICYFFSLELGVGLKRASNNFYTGLFHDFPEVLTRDIISPVKMSCDYLPKLIREYEHEELERRVLRPLREGGLAGLVRHLEWRLGFGAGTVFTQSGKIDCNIRQGESYQALDLFGNRSNDPRDARLVKICDLLSAFLEAHNSIRNGSTSPQLVDGRGRLKHQLEAMDDPALNLTALLADFE